MTNFKINIVSDTVCPWCYVGKKKFESGIAAYNAAHPNSGDTFEITWMPFQLNPDSPKDGWDKQTMYRERFGEERAQQIHDRLSRAGREVGIKFDFGGRTGNTRESHRLIQLGKSKGPDAQTKVVDALFASYFEHKGDITSHEMLKAAALEAGLDAAEIDEWLKSDKGGDQVDAELRASLAMGVNSVPHFVIQDKFELRGAQDAEGFKAIFERVKALD